MDKNDWDFDTWFENLQMHVLDGCGVDFCDHESVRSDYENGFNMFDVADAIIGEYEG